MTLPCDLGTFHLLLIEKKAKKYFIYFYQNVTMEK